MPQPILGKPVDDRTDGLALPKPSLSNFQEDDVPRIRLALELIDDALQLLHLDMDTRDADLSARAALLEFAAARPSVVSYGYDAQGRVATITQTVAGALRTTTLGYDAQGRIATAAYPVAGGAVRTDTYQYDAGTGRLAGVASTEAKP
ncbi:RHS repeat domain-containing protein [Paracidovorax citrulli]|uniref:RHS repeat domain-containing protein n=1 Tax=Paracidovorax citrulli TaxID=80869 RepID=UPI000699027E|nr:RHS repeat domain-containing protein [Paracidovorax citrulli]